MKKFIKVLIVDDHKIFVEGLKSLILEEKNIRIIGEANKGLLAVKLSKLIKPDVILMDIKLPDVDGITTIKKILKMFRRWKKKPKVIVLSMYDDEAHILESIRVGAMGYVSKTCGKEEIIEAIQRVYDGELFIQKFTAPKFLNAIKNLEFDAEKPLTAREIEIMKLVAQGFSNKEIAKVVYSAEKTVKNQLNSIFQKLNAVNRAEAVKEAIRRNLISSDLP